MTSTIKISCLIGVYLMAMLLVASAMPAPGGHGGYGGGGTSNIFRKDHGYDNYDFGYDIADHYTGDKHGRRESKRGYDVIGSYSLRDPYGYPRKVNYVSDHYGTHQTVHGSPHGLYIHSKDLTVVPSYH